MKKVITKQERLQLIGLMELSRQHYKIVEECSEAMEKIVGAKKWETLLTDEYFEDKPDVDKCLKEMTIKVK